MKFFGRQQGEKTVIYERGSMEAYLKSLDGKEICLEITKVKIKRSLNQNSGFHLLMQFFADALTNLTGEEYRPDRVKAMVCAKFLAKAIIDRDGNYLDAGIGSTSSLSLPEMSALIEKVYQWAWDSFSITLPALEPKKE